MNTKIIAAETLPSNRDSILIFRSTVSSLSGRMYLCADGTTSSERSHAQEHWGSQFIGIATEAWIVQPAQWELSS